MTALTGQLGNGVVRRRFDASDDAVFLKRTRIVYSEDGAVIKKVEILTNRAEVEQIMRSNRQVSKHAGSRFRLASNLDYDVRPVCTADSSEHHRIRLSTPARNVVFRSNCGMSVN